MAIFTATLFIKQTWSVVIKSKEVIKNIKKIHFWGKGAILGPILPRITQVNISGSALTNFWELSGIIGHNRKTKVT